MCRPDIVCPSRSGCMMQPAKVAHDPFPARRKLAASGSSRAPCAFPNLRCDPRCWLFSCLGLWSHLHIFPKEHQKERCGHSRSQRSFITFFMVRFGLFCCRQYFLLQFHDNVRTNVCQRPFAENFRLLPLLNRIDSISNLYIFT